jgi:ribosomal protein S18 acetylase RimI-like enzyme
LACVVVAQKASRVVGFGVCAKVTDQRTHNDGTSCKQSLQNMLDWAHIPDDRDLLIDHLKSRKERLGGSVVVRFYDNSFLRQKTDVADTDYYFSDVAVDPAHRKQGIGTKLVKKRMEIAKADGAEAVFACCWHGGNALSILRAQEFFPLVTMGPLYPDGSAGTYVGKLFVDG